VTDDEIVTLGDFCVSLRENGNFQALVKQFELQTIDHFMSTEAHETKKREGIYASLAGCRDFIVGHMNGVIDAAAKIVAENKPAPSEYDAPIQEDID